MIEIGRLCIKIAGRDAGKRCVIVDILENNRVLIDGETRRRKVNAVHIEPLEQTLDIKKGASAEKVAEAFKKLGVELSTSKPKKTAERPRKARKSKLAETPKVEKAPKKAVKAKTQG